MIHTGTNGGIDVPRREPGLVALLVGDGRPLLALTGFSLLFAGVFALFLSMRREFLPHDIAFLGMTAEQLCALAECRVVAFMFHDRVAFGGTLIAIGITYLWLAQGPLRAGEGWAWWAMSMSGAAGFLSFLAYLGYGYLDTWHGVATLALLPCFVMGLFLTRRRVPEPLRAVSKWSRPAASDARLLVPARWLLVATGAGIAAAGLTILGIGLTHVFVATDLEFMGLDAAALDAVSPRLIPLIAHDRAGFGGGLVSTGILIAFCAWHAAPARAYRDAMAIAGAAGFGCAIGVHFAEGYTDALHLAPAVTGAALFLVAITFETIGLARTASDDLAVPAALTTEDTEDAEN